MKIILNLLIWFIFVFPANIWWYYTMVSNYKSAVSWADKTAVVIIAIIFVVVTAITILTIIMICTGYNVFGA